MKLSPCAVRPVPSLCGRVLSCKVWLHKAALVEHGVGEPGWRVPHGGGWDPTPGSLLLTLAQALPADGSAPELDKPLGNHCIICYVPSVPPLTPPSSKCHRHQGRNKSLSGTEREKGERAGKRRDEKCPFYDSHNKAGHMIRSKHYFGKREGENGGGISKRQRFSPLEGAQGEL